MYLFYSFEVYLVEKIIHIENYRDVIGTDGLTNHFKWLFCHFMLVPGTAQWIWTRPRTSLCPLTGLSLLSRPHFLFMFSFWEIWLQKPVNKKKLHHKCTGNGPSHGPVQDNVYMGNFTQGWEWLLKNGTIFFYREANISLKVNIDSKQPACMLV